MSSPQPRPNFGTSTHTSYHPGGYGVSEGLKRARRPFIVRNAVTGSAIAAFAVGVYWYSISKVKQDDFSDLSDVRVPQAPVQATGPAAAMSERPADPPAVATAPSGGGAAAARAQASAPSARVSDPNRRLV